MMRGQRGEVRRTNGHVMVEENERGADVLLREVGKVDETEKSLTAPDTLRRFPVLFHSLPNLHLINTIYFPSDGFR